MDTEDFTLTESAGLNLQRNGTALWGQLQARWDWANTEWNRWVLGYGPELQALLMKRCLYAK